MEGEAKALTDIGVSNLRSWCEHHVCNMHCHDSECSFKRRVLVTIDDLTARAEKAEFDARFGERVRCELKEWRAKLRGIKVKEEYDTHALDYIISIHHHYSRVEAERDALRESRARLVAAASDLLELMDSVGEADGNETNRVFPRYEFDNLRATVLATRDIGSPNPQSANDRLAGESSTKVEVQEDKR